MKREVNKEYTSQLMRFTECMEPSLYQVVLHNDDFTPMEFVVDILERFFHMDRRQAANVMMDVHTKGQAVCGIFSKDCAETKVYQVIEQAQTNDHPLFCSMEASR